MVTPVTTQNPGTLGADSSYFTSSGDLLAYVEQLSSEAKDHVRGVARAAVKAQQNNLAVRARLLDVADKLNALVPSSDGTRLILGADLAKSEALKAELESLGLSLSTSESSDGNLTASNQDITKVLEDIVLLEAGLQKSYTDEALHVQAMFNELKLLLPSDEKKHADARHEESRLLGTRLSDQIDTSADLSRERLRRQRGRDAPEAAEIRGAQPTAPTAPTAVAARSEPQSVKGD